MNEKHVSPIIAGALSAAILFTAVACNHRPEEPLHPDGGDSMTVEPFPTGRYTWKDAVSTLPTNWNPHTYATADDAYPLDFLVTGLYAFVFNDALHPVEGKAPYEGYAIVPEMAAALPADVTEQIKKSHPRFGIPADAKAGYAYTIDLNPAAKWQDGTPITADTYVESMQRLLDPKLLNYRATDYYAGDFAVAGAERYATGSGKWEDVGLFKSGEYQITLVLAKSLSGFDLLYNLTGNWLVYKDIYDKAIISVGETFQSRYCTDQATTMSYGPYKLVNYQDGKAMRFEKNENWYGYTDGHHVYIDPTDGKTYPMYQTTAIDCRVVAEAATRKMLFLKGELMTYGLQPEDFAAYRGSEYCYETPGTSTFFLILNGHADAIARREAAAGFDQSRYDLGCLTITAFRRALGMSYDRERFAGTVSPARKGGYGLIGSAYVYDPVSGAKYRDTDEAKRALCAFYGVDPAGFASLDEAVGTITGYNVEGARALFAEAFREALAAGHITDKNGDGICDQTIRIEYCVAADSEFMTKTVNYLNTALAPVLKGTPFEGRIEFVKSTPYGNTWVDVLKSGMADTVLGGWSGSALNPFGLTELYVNPAYAYDAAWFDPEKISLSVEISGERITLNLRQWSKALNGESVTVDGVSHNFGSGQADGKTRLSILAAFEARILDAVNYLPMLEDNAMALLSRQVYYVVEDYNPVVGRGGLAYTKYNYNDADWAAYVSEQEGGRLEY